MFPSSSPPPVRLVTCSSSLFLCDFFFWILTFMSLSKSSQSSRHLVCQVKNVHVSLTRDTRQTWMKFDFTPLQSVQTPFTITNILKLKLYFLYLIKLPGRGKTCLRQRKTLCFNISVPAVPIEWHVAAKMTWTGHSVIRHDKVVYYMM